MTVYRRIALVIIINAVVDYSDDDSPNKRTRGPDRAWIWHRREKGAFATTFTDLSLTDKEGFRRYMRMELEQFNELTKSGGWWCGENGYSNATSRIATGDTLATTGFLELGESPPPPRVFTLRVSPPPRNQTPILVTCLEEELFSCITSW